MEIKPKDLINLTLRINNNYSAPFGDTYMLPGNYLNPYPIEEKEMKITFLKFNMNPSQRLKPPMVYPTDRFVSKGTTLSLIYPDTNIRDVFFRFTDKDNFIPTYFSGEKFENTNPYQIIRDCTLKICSCRFGFMDSEIITVNYQVQEVDGMTVQITDKDKAIFLKHIERPEIELEDNIMPYIPDEIIPIEDDFSSSRPGSSIHKSFYQRESHYNNDDDI